MPDLMEGSVADPAWFTGAEGAQKKMGEFFGPGGPCYPPTMIEEVMGVVKEIKESGVEKIGVMGYCWGAKVSGSVFGRVGRVKADLTVRLCLLSAVRIRRSLRVWRSILRCWLLRMRRRLPCRSVC
jgi:hypothetical protein